jgi:hypothetical protein
MAVLYYVPELDQETRSQAFELSTVSPEFRNSPRKDNESHARDDEGRPPRDKGQGEEPAGERERHSQLQADGSKERNAKDHLEDLPPTLVRDICRHSGRHPSHAFRLAFEATPPNALGYNPLRTIPISAYLTWRCRVDARVMPRQGPRRGFFSLTGRLRRPEGSPGDQFRLLTPATLGTAPHMVQHEQNPHDQQQRLMYPPARLSDSRCHHDGGKERNQCIGRAVRDHR